MISTSGRKAIERFVVAAKTLMFQSITAMLQRDYGIWSEGRVDSVSRLTSKNSEITYRARLLRQRLDHIKNSLPNETEDADLVAIRQLTAEQAFTIINRFCAIRMCEERELILPSIAKGYESDGFAVYDAVTGGGAVGSTYQRYTWYLQSLFDELATELPAVFDRYSPYGLLQPDEQTLLRLFELINDQGLTQFYDEQSGEVVNFWKENETLGWIFQYYNSIDERRLMREQSNRPRNSREMAVRNQFFTPDYVVRFLTDNSLGRMWYEMTGGETDIVSLCQYMIRRPGEEIAKRPMKDPLELSMLDPACGSMHFGLYTYEVMEAIYLDAWDHHPELWQDTLRYDYITRDDFRRMVPKLILENNIYGVEIDPRALQIAALSLWLRAQQSWSEQGIARQDRPTIERSHLVLAEAMPGNKRMLRLLTEGMEAPMRRLVEKVWEKMKYVGEAGLLIKMEQEIADEIEELRKNWGRVNAVKSASLFSSDEEKAKIEAENKARMALQKNKGAFFAQVTERLQQALQELSSRLSETDGYENTLFANDAVRGFAFIELCQRRYDVILMNPPFGEGSENTVEYLEQNYTNWCRNLVCAFFIRMQEMVADGGRVGAIFDRTVFIKTQYVKFRKQHFCGYITSCADTGWNVLDANVETSSIVITNTHHLNNGVFIDVRDISPEDKDRALYDSVQSFVHEVKNKTIYVEPSYEFEKLPNSIIGYYFDATILKLFQNTSVIEQGFEAKGGYKFYVEIFCRLFYEVEGCVDYYHVAGNGKYSLVYAPYREMAEWKQDGKRAKALVSFRFPNQNDQFRGGVYFGERGEIFDCQVMKKGMFFTQEYNAFPCEKIAPNFVVLSYMNSILAQYLINLYTGAHKMPVYINKCPIPNITEPSTAQDIVIEIIRKKRYWLSLDETNLEYRGMISQLPKGDTLAEMFDALQEKLTADNEQYLDLVRQNDDLWMDLADIAPDSDFRKTLNSYKSRRPYEELLSIDNASSQNIIDKKVLAQEVVQELVGMAFRRWSVEYAIYDDATLPEFDGIFDPLPFMPKVALNEDSLMHDGQDFRVFMLRGSGKNNIVDNVRHWIRMIWPGNADDIEYEICQLIGVDSLQTYFDNPAGFFAYHFKRYTKSRRKAPIYWPISSPNGKMLIWVYYPRLSEQTLPNILLLLAEEKISHQGSLTNAMANGDRKLENELRTVISDIEWLEAELNRVKDMQYKPNHDDGVPVTAAPLYNSFQLAGWRNECRDNWAKLEKGEYDWSHLAYSLYPSRIRTKVKKDLCLAITHGLEELCEIKPKEKKTRKKKGADDAATQSLLFEDE